MVIVIFIVIVDDFILQTSEYVMRRNVENKIFFEGAHFFGPKLSTEEFTI